MKQAAGILSVTADGRVLLLRRTAHDHAGEWAFAGGGVEGDESPEQAARREYAEELGAEYNGKLALWTRRQSDGVDFWTYLAVDAEAFDPTLNDEHDDHAWVDRHEALDKYQLHPGAKLALLRFDMDELGVAKAMRAGELVSPQWFANMLLVAMRVTGTGASYRKQLDEYVWRDPSLYLNDWFVERCNGLPVILEHPKGKPMLNTEEFRDRIVGTVFLPYIRGDEVWCIAKIWDTDVAEYLAHHQLSTSPAVVFKDEDAGHKYQMEDGKHLLIEGRPSLLDHLALCEVGVWDKGGKAAGVAAEGSTANLPDAGVTKMADEKKVEATAKHDSDGISASKEGEKLDKILAHLDGLHSKHDASVSAHSELCGKVDALAQRLDAFEKKANPGEKKEEEGEHKESAEEEKKAEPTPLAADRKDEEEQKGTESEEAALKHEREGSGLEAKDSGRSDAAFGALSRKIDELGRRIPVEMKDEDRRLFVDAQARAERIAQAFGDSQGAPRWLNGEKLADYRRRLMRKYQEHSRAWKAKDLASVHESVLEIAEDAIYADAYEAALHPATVAEGTLRQVITSDDTGRRIRRFYGDPEACWAPFKQIPRRVTGWNTKPNA